MRMANPAAPAQVAAVVELVSYCGSTSLSSQLSLIRWGEEGGRSSLYRVGVSFSIGS